MSDRFFRALLFTLYSYLLTTTSALANIKLISTYPSDPTAFTQGFERLDGHNILLATGLYGESKIGVLNLKNGQYTVKEQLDKRFFGEGVSVTPNAIWQLTWKENTAFMRDKKAFNVLKTVKYDGEGWGLAYDKNRDVLWFSNGSDKLQQRNPETFEVLSEINVTYQGRSINNINELEFANNSIYANIWQTNYIVRISPLSGEIINVYDMTPILANADLTNTQRKAMDVLNGIAHIEGNRFYVTGKFYPVVFEIEMLP